MRTIDDFGEKIGGAKKDLWKARNFSIDDLNNLSDREAFKFCVKDNVWKKPNYEELCKEKSVQVVWFIKKLRDSLPAKVTPTENEEKNKENRKKYIEFVSLVRDIVMNISTESALYNLFDNIFVKNGYYDKKWTEKARLNNSIENKFVKISQINSRAVEKAKVEIEKTGFPNKKTREWNENIKIMKRKDGFHIIKTRGYYYEELVQKSFSTEQEADTYLNTILKQQIESSKKERLSLNRPQLSRITRNGIKTRNTEYVSTDMMLKTFCFRGGEFGLWANDTERQMHLNYAYDALIDLAYILNVSPEFISLGKRLGIAFGSRGSGNNLAHYEPSKVVINLTKIRGAGCLGHEWMHGFDDFLGNLCKNNISSPYASDNIKDDSAISKELLSKFKVILRLLHQKNASKEEKIISYEEKIKLYRHNLDTWVNPIKEYLTKEQSCYGGKTRRSASDEEIKLFSEIKMKIYNGELKALDELNSLHKQIKGRILDKKNKNGIYGNLHWLHFALDNLKNIDETNLSVNSDYYKNAKEIDKTRKKPYWATNCEMLARAFEAYIQDRLEETGYQSDYLVHHADNSAFSKFKPYPEGEERIQINKAFEDFFSTFQKEMKLEKFDLKLVESKNSKIEKDVSSEFINTKKFQQISFSLF